MAREKTRDELIADEMERDPAKCRTTGAFLGVLGGVLLLGVWGAFHVPQIAHFSSFWGSYYATHGGYFGKEPPPLPENKLPTSEHVVYRVLTEGNLNHRFDRAILHYHLYPATEQNPAKWVFENRAWPSYYSRDGKPSGYIFRCIGLLIAGPFIGFLIGLYMDRQHRRKQLAGIRVDGVRVLGSLSEYNREVKGTGMRYYVIRQGQKGSRMIEALRIGDLLSKVIPQGIDRFIPAPFRLIPREISDNEYIQLDERKEASHQIRAGDTGSGKSTLFRQDMLDAKANGIHMIVTDPEGEFLSEFYEEGDWVLNPADLRCPYWNIADEGWNYPSFKSVANALFPLQSERDRIFNDWTTDLTAFLLSTYRPNTETFAYWLAKFSEIDERIKGTNYKYTLPKNAAGQRAAVLGTMSLAGAPLGMMPTLAEKEERDLPTFSMLEWTRNPSGNIWITSDPNTREALIPFHSMMLDLAILGLMSSKTKRRVRILADELNLLNHIPNFPIGFFNLRKRGHAIYPGFQNLEQLDRLYPGFAKTMASQPFTKWIFRTSEEHSAESLSKTLGTQDRVVLKKNRSSEGLWGRVKETESFEVVTRQPIVQPTNIAGMGDLEAWFVQPGFKGKLVAIPVTIPRCELPKIAPSLIERDIPDRPIWEDDEEEDEKKKQTTNQLMTPEMQVFVLDLIRLVTKDDPDHKAAAAGGQANPVQAKGSASPGQDGNGISPTAIAAAAGAGAQKQQKEKAQSKEKAAVAASVLPGLEQHVGGRD